MLLFLFWNHGRSPTRRPRCWVPTTGCPRACICSCMAHPDLPNCHPNTMLFRLNEHTRCIPLGIILCRTNRSTLTTGVRPLQNSWTISLTTSKPITGILFFDHSTPSVPELRKKRLYMIVYLGDRENMFHSPRLILPLPFMTGEPFLCPSNPYT
jgi:hypothetical protein